ncbi:MAG: esterase [Chloroflexi bacterium]|nr:esterase [Chloroflexota bacterium]MCC6896303.1 phosphotriesterase [Anaerolineae bacterium]
MAILRTLKGDIPTEKLGFILPHEHLFVDLRGPLAPGHGEGEPEVVGQLVKPYLDAIQAKGVTAFVDCAPLGVGRNIRAMRHVASLTPIHIVVPTGVYKEGFIPTNWLDISAEALAEHWISEITDGIEGTDSKAGFIKTALVDDGPKAIEARNLRAAAIASQATGAIIGSHTIGGRAAREEMDILEAAGQNLNRFIWIHTQTEPDTSIHIEAAKRGAWVEFDAIGANPELDGKMLDYTVNMLDVGYGAQVLLSHDAGWYEVGSPGGVPQPQGYRGYTALMDTFLPALRERGATDADIHLLTVTNPARAFGI